MSYQLIVMLGITISTFPGCRCDYVFYVSDAGISMQCLVVDKPWGSGDPSQIFCLETLQYFGVGRFATAPQLYAVSPYWFEDDFIQQ
jgi:hypothetical protein